MRLKDAGLLVAGMVILSASFLTAVLTNTILMPEPATVSLSATPAGPDDIKPAQCSETTLTAIVTGSGAFSGTAASELILSEGGTDLIDGGAGDDCIVSGDGADELNGGDGYDVCIASPTVVLFMNCEEQHTA